MCCCCALCCRVLTSEWVDGKAPAQLLEASTSSTSAREREAAAAQLLALVQMGVQCSLAQLLETGVVHADPHPGNLLLAPSGRLVYLDFGLLSRVTPERSQVGQGGGSAPRWGGGWKRPAAQLFDDFFA